MKGPATRRRTDRWTTAIAAALALATVLVSLTPTVAAHNHYTIPIEYPRIMGHPGEEDDGTCGDVTWLWVSPTCRSFTRTLPCGGTDGASVTVDGPLSGGYTVEGYWIVSFVCVVLSPPW